MKYTHENPWARSRFTCDSPHRGLNGFGTVSVGPVSRETRPVFGGGSGPACWVRPVGPIAANMVVILVLERPRSVLNRTANVLPEALVLEKMPRPAQPGT